MSIFKTRRFFDNNSRLEQYRRRLKLEHCPHCLKVGHLNNHGFLRGYSEVGSEEVVRGYRVFCSNRNCRSGCGRTYSILLSDLLFGFVVRAWTLWLFVQNVSAGASRKAAWEKAAPGFSVESGYRLWRSMSRSLSRLRELLCRKCIPPDSNATLPLVQLLEHMRCAFPFASSPFASFQSYFQTALLD